MKKWRRQLLRGMAEVLDVPETEASVLLNQLLFRGLELEWLKEKSDALFPDGVLMGQALAYESIKEDPPIVALNVLREELVVLPGSLEVVTQVGDFAETDADEELLVIEERIPPYAIMDLDRLIFEHEQSLKKHAWLLPEVFWVQDESHQYGSNWEKHEYVGPVFAPGDPVSYLED